MNELDTRIDALSVASTELCSVLSELENAKLSEADKIASNIAYAKELQERLKNMELHLKKKLRESTTT